MYMEMGPDETINEVLMLSPTKLKSERARAHSCARNIRAWFGFDCECAESLKNAPVTVYAYKEMYVPNRSRQLVRPSSKKYDDPRLRGVGIELEQRQYNGETNKPLTYIETAPDKSIAR